ncbi:TPA: hypothetical protein IAC10_00785 [Candidatus Scatousia excrementigallinarum]|uniref:Peptidase C39-like domain-containing protein n=1 Tax=Candidatus Scatousia excrementigallinarum TaxID=2840935 RepID=A0A9D1EWX9_9BACT|nr:hypothetical protein [Candidatus Scatousia excrementigallinarum]
MKSFLTVLLSAIFAISLCVMQHNKEMTFADGYNGASLENSETVSINFVRKEDNEIMINGGMPEYSDKIDLANSCANVAGAILLGYYDKTYDELIENFSAARVIRDKILYSKQTEAVDEVMAELYTTMKTNVTEGGTTIGNFKAGLKEYVNGQGRNISYSQVVSNQSLNFNTYESAIAQEKPVVLFCSKYSLVSLQAFDAEYGTEQFVMQHYTGNHVVIGYGIRTITYYDAAGRVLRQLDLLAVATGYSFNPFGYIVLDDYGTLIDGYKVNIY